MAIVKNRKLLTIAAQITSGGALKAMYNIMSETIDCTEHKIGCVGRVKTAQIIPPDCEELVMNLATARYASSHYETN